MHPSLQTSTSISSSEPDIDPSEESLCSSCSSMLRIIVQPTIATGEVCVGALQFIIPGTPCPFCTTLFNVINPTDPSLKAAEPSNSVQNCYLDVNCDEYGRYARVRLGSQERGTIRFLDKDQETDPFTRRSADQLSIPLVRGWLKDCESTPHSTCSRPILAKQAGSPVDLLLIDVDRKCLVRAKSFTRYAALSYVWGGIEGLNTTKSTLDSLLQPGSLYSQSRALPGVIQDSIVFLKAIEEAYLWVDCLCIVQDDADRKHQDIQQMDVIYSHAALTLVALSATDANAAIPGIRAGSRDEWQPKPFGNFRYVQAALPLNQALQMSPLDDRAWTMQERMLSRRCIYFTNQQAYFQCLHGVKAEIPAADHQVAYGAQQLLSNPLARMHRFEDKWKGEEFAIYSHLVQEYTRRQLSYDSDILNAFSGVAGALTKYGSGEFHYGIPRRAFALALLWYPTAQLKRRYVDKKPFLPSWAWAGWVGPVKWPDILYNEIEQFQSFIETHNPAIEAPSNDSVLRIKAFTSKGFYIDYSLVCTAHGLQCGKLWGEGGVLDLYDESGLEFVHLFPPPTVDVQPARYTLAASAASLQRDLVLNIMVIRNLTDGFSERVALCRIERRAWEDSNPTQRWVNLI